jgi:hypothetical protein
MPETGTVRCESCPRVFKTRSGLSQHERTAHPLVRNAARELTSNQPSSKPLPKSYGKIWTQTEIELMLDMEVRFYSNPRIAKAMEPYLPGKKITQIRDKRREPGYRRRLAEATQHLNPLSHQQDIMPAETIPSTATEDSHGIPPEPIVPGDMEGDLTPPPRLGEKRPNTPLNQAPSTHQPEQLLFSTLTDQMNSIATHKTKASAFQEQLICDIKNVFLNDQTITKLKRDLQDQFLALFNNMATGRPSELQNDIDKLYTEITDYVLGDTTVQHPKKTRKNTKPTTKKKMKQIRRYKYARTQHLFNTNPGRLAQYIRDDIPWLEDTDEGPPPHDIQALYDSLWGIKSDVTQTLPFKNKPADGIFHTEDTILSLISEKEIKSRIGKIKKSSAPGLDGIEPEHLRKPIVQATLRHLFNILQTSGLHPTALKTNSTVLILKHGKNPLLADSYRPITIGSLISRTYWGSIDQRLRNITTFSPRQKGFVNENGCYNNVHTLSELIRLAKEKTGIVVTQLDITKDFDSIPHHAIGPALSKHGIPDSVRAAITRAYHKSTTTIRYRGSNIPINLERGVKQGDPLSPYIFNILVDPLLDQLEQQKGYTIDERHSISCLAFADDLLLIADSQPKAQHLLDLTEAYFAKLDMKIAVKKCASFQIAPTKDSWFIKDPKLHLSTGEIIPSSSADDTLTYLGGNISPWSGIFTKIYPASYKLPSTDYRKPPSNHTKSSPS